MVVVVVTGCGKASRGFHHTLYDMEGNAYAYAYAYLMYAKARLLERTNVGLLNGFLRVCVRGKDMSLLPLLLLE